MILRASDLGGNVDDDGGTSSDEAVTINANKVQVGSKEYLDGFLSSPIQDDTINTAERGTGLEQGLKLAGSATVVLVVLFLGFVASNGLL